MKRLLASIVALALLAGSAAGDWPPPLFSGGSSAAAGARANPAVVRIMAPGRDSVSYGSGSLVAKSQQHGLVVTNWHVINEATGQIMVMFPDGFSSAGTVIKVDRDWDLAAIAVWRPNAEPLPLAKSPPQPGEVLTIAGYGSGTFRTASGRCTQYVAPGTSFPFEMVELATTARQGDSGGPILNNRGEVAGVLFGEGGGRTAGSYCGRVQWFLDGLLPAQPLSGAGLIAAGAPAAAGPAANPYAPPGQTGARVASLAALGMGAPAVANSPPPAPRAMPPARQPMAPAAAFASAGTTKPAADRIELGGTGWQSAAPRGSTGRDRDLFDDPDSEMASVPTVRAIPDTAAFGQTPQTTTYPPSNQSDNRSDSIEASGQNHQGMSISWTDIAGETIGQQIKSVLATIGGLAVALHALSWVSRDSSSKKKQTDDDQDDDD